VLVAHTAVDKPSKLWGIDFLRKVFHNFYFPACASQSSSSHRKNEETAAAKEVKTFKPTHN
jgi:hypothetical protein